MCDRYNQTYYRQKKKHLKSNALADVEGVMSKEDTLEETKG